MAVLQPFAALRPRPDLAARLCELPYDVVSAAEARQLAADNPLSFFHVSRPEIDLPPDTDPCAAAVYARGRENFQRLVAQGALQQDARPCSTSTARSWAATSRSAWWPPPVARNT
jgi:uncharacterized protein (DUF1015 family)